MEHSYVTLHVLAQGIVLAHIARSMAAAQMKGSPLKGIA